MSYQMTPYLEKIIEKVERDYTVGKNISPLFSKSEEMIKWLHTPIPKAKGFITTHAKAVKNLDI